jgi:prepilin-type N-terminal cleavage/methylation domain-containing protein
MSHVELSPSVPPRDAGFSLAEVLVATVVSLIGLGIVTDIFVQSDAVYATQRQYLEARTDAAGALDMIVRLVRQGGELSAANPALGVNVDPDGNNAADSIRVVADWNPRNGAVTDAYEDVTFTVAGGILFKQEPADGAPVPFAEQVNALTFTYRTPDGLLLTTPWTANKRNLAHVTVSLQSTPVNGSPGRTFTSSASIRRRE